MPDTTIDLQRLLDVLEGDAPTREFAWAQLLDRAYQRLCQHADGILRKSFPRLLRPPAQVDPKELVHEVVKEFLEAPPAGTPETVRAFFALTGKRMRFRLHDLARELKRRPVRLEQPQQISQQGSGEEESLPEHLIRLYEELGKLSDLDAEIIDLRVTYGMTEADSARLLRIDERTLRRHWLRIKMTLGEALAEFFPES